MEFESISDVLISHFNKILCPPLDPLESTLTHIDSFGGLSCADTENLMKPISVEEIEYVW